MASILQSSYKFYFVHLGGGSSSAGIPCRGNPIQILSPDKTLCEYGDRRTWGLMTEKISKKTCGQEVFINPHAFMK